MTTENEYYSNIRKDILPLLPAQLNRVLEVGCGTGNTLAWLKENRGCEWIGGVEMNRAAATQAAAKLDALYQGNIEQLDLPILPSTLDLILCLDVLEHLVDPWQVTSSLQRLLKPGGSLIISVPNIRNRRILFPLLFKGKWEYTEAGILDKTHLRFFVRETAIKLVESAGFDVDMIRTTGLERKTKKSRIFISLLPESIRSFLILQYVIRGIKPLSGGPPLKGHLKREHSSMRFSRL
ncbi:MAG TPA: methyltransferase domain-containing protein [Nitrospirota bacterium]|nr:methyltransferase domain-containing protein [Nitrospirota bacterium]